VYIVGAVVRGRLSCSSSEPQESLDGDLAFRVFQLIQVMDQGFHATRYGAESRQRLDLAVLNFFGNFRKVYVGEQAMHSSKVYVQLSERMGLHDHLMVMNLTVTKITQNLKCFAQVDKVVEASLNLLQDLAVGFMSGKLLLRLDAINATLANHTPDHFPFLSQYANTRNRTIFYATLARLLFMEDDAAKFAEFMAPFGALCEQLSNAARSDVNAFRSDAVKHTLIGLFRDLVRGEQPADVQPPVRLDVSAARRAAAARDGDVRGRPASLDAAAKIRRRVCVEQDATADVRAVQRERDPSLPRGEQARRRVRPTRARGAAGEGHGGVPAAV
jgi:hypothetical protein